MSGLATAEDIFEREERDLAAWAVRARSSEVRVHRIGEDPTRTCFQRDRDRIVHSRAFRRLAYKTQVFPNEQGDLYRSRLTHTMEVAQLARSAARSLGANEDLVECLALAHDLGHPPFGHRGEDMLAELMREHGGFDHHHQALRIVEELEVRYPEHPGLNLTTAVREGLAKLGCVRERGRIPRRYDRSTGPVVEAQLVDEIDTIAYVCHDIDDGLRAGILHPDALTEVPLWQGAWDAAVADSPRATPAKLLGDRALRILLDAFLQDLVETSAETLAARRPADAAAVQALEEPLIRLSPSQRQARDQLADWLFEHLYRDWRINRTFHRARTMLSRLFAFFCEHVDTLPAEHQARVEATGCERAVADYLAGMTDRYARDVARELLG